MAVGYVVSFLVLTGAVSVSAETIKLSSGEWPPYTSQSLPHYGYLSRIVSEAFALQGIKVEYGFFPWKRAFVYAEKGFWDGSVGWSKNPEREKVFFFPETAIHTNREVFFYRQDDDFEWQTLADLEGLRVGALRGYVHVKRFESALEAGTQFILEVNESEDRNLKMLLLKRIDVFPCSEVVCNQYLRTKFSQEERASLSMHPTSLSENPLYLIISKESEQAQYWLQAFERGMKQLKESGRYRQIRQDFYNGTYDNQ